MIEKEQPTLFDCQSIYDEHWQDMPEFNQERQKPFSKIIVRIASQEDLDSFAKLIGQRLTPKTKSIWYPFKSHWREGKQPKWKSDE